MNKINSICLFLLIFYSLTFQSFAQNSLKKNEIVNKEFWLKMPLPDFSECKMIISLEGIDLPKDYCTYVYSLDEKETMYNLKKVKIISLEKKRNWTKIKFKEKDEDAVIIYLKEVSKENLIKLWVYGSKSD